MDASKGFSSLGLWEIELLVLLLGAWLLVDDEGRALLDDCVITSYGSFYITEYYFAYPFLRIVVVRMPSRPPG